MFERLLLVSMALIEAGAAAPGPNAQRAPVATPAKPATPAVAIPRAVFIGNMDNDYRKMDGNHDGMLTPQEFTVYHHQLAIAQAQQRNRLLFVALDTDRNGQLTPAEFAKAVQKVPQPNVSGPYAKLDANHDNKVSLVEYRAATVANFDKLDTDKDGIASPAEMRAAGIIK